MSHMTLATPETDNEETTNVRGALPHSASVARPAAEVWTTAPPPIRKTRVRRISRWLLLLAALGGLIVLAAAFFAGKEEPPPEAAPQSQSANAMRVSIVHPTLTTLSRTIRQPGSVHVFDYQNIFAKVSG